MISTAVSNQQSVDWQISSRTTRLEIRSQHIALHEGSIYSCWSDQAKEEAAAAGHRVGATRTLKMSRSFLSCISPWQLQRRVRYGRRPVEREILITMIRMFAEFNSFYRDCGLSIGHLCQSLVDFLVSAFRPGSASKEPPHYRGHRG